MKIIFLKPAQEEYEQAVAYYNEQKKDLGLEFVLELKKSLKRIVEFPQAWQKLSQRSRRCRLKKFPYGLVYAVKSDLILILAVMHLKQKPKKWEKRLSSIAKK